MIKVPNRYADKVIATQPCPSGQAGLMPWKYKAGIKVYTGQNEIFTCCNEEQCYTWRLVQPFELD